MSISLIAKLFCLVFAVIYKVISYVKKDDIAHKHYSLMSEVWIVGLVVTIAITNIEKKVCEKKQDKIEVKADTTKSLNKKLVK